MVGMIEDLWVKIKELELRINKLEEKLASIFSKIRKLESGKGGWR